MSVSQDYAQSVLCDHETVSATQHDSRKEISDFQSVSVLPGFSPWRSVKYFTGELRKLEVIFV
jgi:hypothetical protein